MGATVSNYVEVEMSKGWIVTHRIDDDRHVLEITANEDGIHFCIEEGNGIELQYAMSVQLNCTKAEAKELFESILRNMPDDAGHED